jgi:hypothetical protein
LIDAVFAEDKFIAINDTIGVKTVLYATLRIRSLDDQVSCNVTLEDPMT